ncbi:pyroglutamyl-peptidase I, putative [Bodo saltans]|uniref:Pyroglutamyl-peptidase I, putative n=1 Tax=Bodo saltans TaxID=75058 RepID=A0A0S4JYF2_BODSA|nr:pyroglutamyl-peptidase I, putative [Bodo saltans]|eukprot:CUG94445.1 pyroglutamyl-peptidase I, putative [Bodo saltans]
MKRTAVRLNLTSFGPFLDVVDNPSQKIGETLEEKFRLNDAKGEDNEAKERGAVTVTLTAHRTLEVSVDAVAAYFSDNDGPLSSETAAAAAADDDDIRVVDLLVHLGVHRGAHGEIRVELQGVNDLHCPQGDFKGRKVVHRPIIVARSGSSGDSDCIGCPEVSFDAPQSGDAPFESLRCTIPADVVAKSIELVGSKASSVDDHGRFPVSMMPSDDAGRYLCNYCYCRSLFYTSHVCQRTHNRKYVSLFIHVLDPDRGGGDEDGESLLNPSIEEQADCIFRFLHHLAENIAVL